jgi:AcrR family transcriptional regulator
MSDVAGPTAEIRRVLDVSTDPRVARTRAAITAAVHRLVEQGQELTVAAIVRAAAVSRATFYSHFAGLDDLAESLTRETFHEIAEVYNVELGTVSSRAEAMRQSQVRLVDYFVANRAIFAAVAAMPVSKNGYLKSVRAMADEIEASLLKDPVLPSELQLTATARYIAGAAYGLIDAWLFDDVELTAPQLVDHLVALLPPWMSGVTTDHLRKESS